MSQIRKVLVWAMLAIAIGAPIILAAQSPLLAWRDPIYIAAGFAGIVGLGILLIQPLLIIGYLPGFSGPKGRRMHRIVGIGLVGAVLIHVGALWVTSPPDVIDVLLFASPTPFSIWGAIAMWAVFATAILAVLRKRVGSRVWRNCHTVLALIIVVTSVAHAMMIEGTMEMVSKVGICALALFATIKVVADLWARALRANRRRDT